MMQRGVAGGLVRRSAVVPPSLTALTMARRSAGERRPFAGFSEPQGKSPRVKQGTHDSFARRIPGTTKVRYTNSKGRTFTFSIPVTQLTHPPVNRRGAAADGWHDIDTSFSDVGDLEDDMPTEVGERLAALTKQQHGVNDGSGGVLVEVNEEQLRGLHESFVQLCRDYVLMDTKGMKTSMTYNELNTGPDYEHYDRKTRRRRHWIALRHRFEDVRELLWPDNAAAEMAVVRNGSEGDVDMHAAEGRGGPLLSLPEMLEALTWAEAASTFAMRSHRPYDTVDAAEFAALDLAREVRIVAACVGAAGVSQLQGPAASASALVEGEGSEGVEATMPEADQRAATDRFISLAAMCTNHGVPLSMVFSTPSTDAASASPVKSPAVASATEVVAVQQWLCTLPALTRVKDAVRVMSVLQSVADSISTAPTSSSHARQADAQSLPSSLLRFSNDAGEVTDAALLRALCRLVSPSLFPHTAALENVDEDELCVLMRFAAELQEQNTAFLLLQPTADTATATATAERQALQHLTQLAIARCRQLLYKPDGAHTSLMSGDEENIPLVDLQAFAEHHHPAVRVHSKIAASYAQGLRFARLRSPASAALAQLLCRLEEADSRLAPRTHGLRTDLLQHIAHKAALGKAKLALEEVTRALPLLADLMARTSEQQVKAQFDRLLAAMSTSIGVGLQQPQRPATVLALLEGLAACHHVPASYQLLEMVALRLMMRNAFSLAESARAVLAMARLVGPHGVSQAVQQAVAMRIVATVEKSSAADEEVDVLAVLGVLRALRFSLYPSLPSLLLLVAQSRLTADTTHWPPEAHVRYAVLLTSAAGALGAAGEAEEATENAEVVERLTLRAREEMQAGLSTSGPHSRFACADEDACQECLAACAALQFDTAPPVLTAWSQTGTSQRPLHSLRTPLLAVSTLEAMEALQVPPPSTWYAAYERYLTNALQQMLVRADNSEGQAVLEDDALTAERTLYLSGVSKAARAAAAALLEREVGRLDAMLTSGAERSAGTSETADTQPVFTFQQRALSRQATSAALEERLVRYCVALKQMESEHPGDARATAQ